MEREKTTIGRLIGVGNRLLRTAGTGIGKRTRRVVDSVRYRIERMNDPLVKLVNKLERIRKTVDPAISYYLEAHPNRTLAQVNLYAEWASGAMELASGSPPELKINCDAYVATALKELDQALIAYLKQVKNPQTEVINGIHEWIKDGWETTQVADLCSFIEKVVQKIQTEAVSRDAVRKDLQGKGS